MVKSQTKSKERVKEHGEVFTDEREVKAMCDLVKDETERIDSRFLEVEEVILKNVEENIDEKISAVIKVKKKN